MTEKEIRDEDLGDPNVPQPGDPQALQVTLSARDYQAVITGLGELPAKLSRVTINNLEQQMRAAVLAHRRIGAEKRKAADADRLKAAEEKRARKEAKRAKRNGAAPSPPAPAPDAPPSS